MARPMSRNAVRLVDRRAIEEYGLPGIVLMENAGRGCCELLYSLGIAGPVIICAGKGNNAGDGFVMARHLDNRGHTVRLLMFCDPDELRGDARTNFHVIQSANVPWEVLGDHPQPAVLRDRLSQANWIVDALLGTGTQGNVREPYVTAIQAINEASAAVLAVDLPSGMDCDTGQPLGCCVQAEHTATFVARKIGFDAPDAADLTGAVHVIDIGAPRALLTG